MRLYLENYGEAAEPEKLATFEKNIALAFYNKGQHTNALTYFDRVLERWGAGSPKHRVVIVFKLMYDLFIVLKNLYLPLKKGGKPPDKRDNEVFDLIHKRNTTLLYIDNKRLFTEGIAVLRRSSEFDITRVANGAELCMTVGGLFSYAGLFGLGRRFLERGKALMGKDNIKDLITYKILDTFHNHAAGMWSRIKDYDETLVDLALRSGEFFEVVTYIWSFAFVKIEQGQFKDLDLLMERLSEITKVYDHDQARVNHASLKTDLLLKIRRLHDAQIAAEREIAFVAHRVMEPHQIYLIGSKVIAQILLNDVGGAKDAISQAEELMAKQDFVPPIYAGSYLVGRFLTDIHLLKEAIASKNRRDLRELRKKACQSGRAALKNSAKYAPFRTKTLRLMGLYYWLTGKQRKALSWWNKSIEEGERLDARPELSRTYMEIGKRLLEPKSKYKELNGVSIEEYLEKARKMFQEMDLQWDLDELDRVLASN